MDIAFVMRKYEKRLKRLPYVIGIDTGERNGKEIIKVFVLKKTALSDLQPEDIIPKILDGYETDVEEMSAMAVQEVY